MILLLGSLPASAAEVLGFVPAAPTAHQPIQVRVFLRASERIERVNVFQQGDIVELHLLANDVVGEPQPPLVDRVETYTLGAFPAGNYRLRVYVNGPVPVLVQSLPLGVGAATPVPSLDNPNLVLLGLLVAMFGCAFRSTSRFEA